MKNREMNLKQVSADELTTLAEKVDRLKKEHIILIQARTEIYKVSKNTEKGQIHFVWKEVMGSFTEDHMTEQDSED